MNYLIAGLAKSGTTMLFSRMRTSLSDSNTACYFEPDTDAEIASILDNGEPANTLTKVLIGRVKSSTRRIAEFDRNIMIFRDPRDQFVSMLLYLFYDFQISGDQAGYDACYAALQRKVDAPDAISCVDLWNTVSATVGRAPFNVFNNLHREQLAYCEAFSPHRARYEQLLDGDWQQLEDYLELPLAGDSTQVPDELKRVARSKGYGDWRLWLTESDIRATNEQWADNLAWLQYEPGTTRLDSEIPAETSLHYVSQFNPARQQARD